LRARHFGDDVGIFVRQRRFERRMVRDQHRRRAVAAQLFRRVAEALPQDQDGVSAARRRADLVRETQSGQGGQLKLTVVVFRDD